MRVPIMYSYNNIHFIQFSLAFRYSAVLIPNAPGALNDLVNDQELAKLLNIFIQEKSEFHSHAL